MFHIIGPTLSILVIMGLNGPDLSALVIFKGSDRRAVFFRRRMWQMVEHTSISNDCGWTNMSKYRGMIVNPHHVTSLWAYFVAFRTA